ncbi:hypothetical protein [Stutzerimonas nitrititolerans]|uniref:hypothetical protein n=1 Tax=Stutzerimonas nitrititolerans TaxID=2482751 RepID=UPI0028AB7FE2|nr:hypothetical protein [Stutzerimonas nitrititolerans]
MTQQTVTIHFKYVVGEQEKEGSTEVPARVEDSQTEEDWQKFARDGVFQAICDAEPGLILKTPGRWFGNIKGHKEPETEFIGPVFLFIKEFDENISNLQDYTLHHRLDKPRKLDFP